jgi:hypothetical protein
MTPGPKGNTHVLSLQDALASCFYNPCSNGEEYPSDCLFYSFSTYSPSHTPYTHSSVPSGIFLVFCLVFGSTMIIMKARSQSRGNKQVAASTLGLRVVALVRACARALTDCDMDLGLSQACLNHTVFFSFLPLSLCSTLSFFQIASTLSIDRPHDTRQPR